MCDKRSIIDNITAKDQKRFWDKVSIVGDDDCWEWTASTLRGGYGNFRWKDKMVQSHRFSWMMANKKEIPDGMYVCHHCDNPSCVNPKHLFLGNQKDNVRDCWNKNRHSNQGENHPRNILTKDQVINIKKYINEAEFDYGDKLVFCKFWAKKLEVNSTAIEHVLYNQTWTHIKV